MSVAQEVREPIRAAEPSAAPHRRLRVWPALLILVLGLTLQWVPGFVAPMTMAHFLALFWAPEIMAAAIVVWWLAASRASWREKLTGLALFVAAGAVAAVAVDPSIRGVTLFVLALPVACTLTVLALAIGNRVSPKARRAAAVLAVLVGWGCWTVLRSDGLTGSGGPELTWRWTPTAEQQYLASLGKADKTAPSETSAAEIVAGPGDWPGFRGPNRNGVVPGVRIETDWKAHPPKQVWKHPIGPGWGSVAAVARRLYTQEQRGEEELVTCLDAKTGKELWTHADKTRFWESMAGAGPRATPTFDAGRVYTLGANGLLNCLDAATGKLLWSVDAAKESGAKLPMWGFAASPLVAHGLVVIHTGGPDGKSVLAYHADSGEPAWMAAAGAFSYASPHLVTFAGIEQILMATDEGLVSLDPASGKHFWKYDWPMPQVARIVQPHTIGDDKVLVGTGFGEGTRLLTVSREGDAWKADAGWTSKSLKPYFNDFVTHKGHAYGFDNEIFACIDLDKGERNWRARGYGSGQVVLLPDQDLLLVLTETGELALMKADPAKHTELARVPALEGKTWNHPALVGNRLYVRNAEEIACFELPSGGEHTQTAAPDSERDSALR